nr:MAG: RNA-dependent RNA polymerase [Riboviria sp.]
MDPFGNFDPAKLKEFETLVRTRCELLISGEGYSDPLKVFVKPEPHKLKKVEEGRLRLISAVSLIDTMVDRIAFGWLHDNALASFPATPIMCGWSPANGGWRLIRYNSDDVMCVDKSSWDWTLQEWIVDALEDFVLELGEMLPPEARKLVKARFVQLFKESVFGFIDGTVAKQKGVGIMKSGCFMTLLFNSVSQLLLHSVVCKQMSISPKPWPKCLGDDTIQQLVPDVEQYVGLMGKLGCTLKVKTGEVEFAGFRFSKTTCVPAYTKKHLFKLAYSNNFCELLVAMQLLYAHSPSMTALLRKIAITSGNPTALVSRTRAFKLLA